METFLLQFFIFLVSAAIAVPFAKKLGLGSVLGYLVAGVIIGPFGTSLIEDTKDVMHFTEFGVVLMLFLIGLELKPSLMWKMRTSILGIGGFQVFVTGLAIFVIALYFLPWQQALATGMVLSLSSTAIVLQTLQEKDLMSTQAGRSIFSILLFQDLAVIPMFALIPLLATSKIGALATYSTGFFDITQLPNYMRALITVGAVIVVFLIGKYACGPIFRFIAASRVREIFVAAALAIVIGTSVLMLAVGLSPALGAFLVGVVLSDSEFRHELESNIEPFKGLLLGIFFVSIGASLNFKLISENFFTILAITFGLILLKILILFIISYLFKVANKQRLLFTLALAQGGEFAFVLFQIAKVNRVMPNDLIDVLISSVVISMFLTPLLFVLNDKVSLKQNNEEVAKKPDIIKKGDHKVIIAGFGRLGTDVGRFLLSVGIKLVILDYDIKNVKVLRKLGFEVYYGDATRLSLLEASGIGSAEILVVAIDDTQKAKQLIQLAKKHYPHVKIVANAHDREAAFEMMDLGVDDIHRKTFGTALALGQSVIEKLGVDPYKAHRLSLIFKKKEKDMMPELYKLRNQEESYIFNYQQHHKDLEKMMELYTSEDNAEVDKVWKTTDSSNN